MTMFRVKLLKFRCMIIILALLSFFFTYKFSVRQSSAQPSDVASSIDKRNKLWKDIAERQNRAALGRHHRGPDVICIGVRKCGTGSLKEFLFPHPLIRMSKTEIHYYDAQRERGFEYYKHQLPKATAEEIIMEKTPAYFVALPYELPKIIRQDSPNVKIIVMLCNPVKRAFSDYVMRLTQKRPSGYVRDKPFEKYIDDYLEPVRDLFRNSSSSNDRDIFEARLSSLHRQKSLYTFAFGLYSYFLQRWRKEFPPSQVLIIDGEKFLKDPGAAIEKVQDFLGIPRLLTRNDFAKNQTTGLFCLKQFWKGCYETPDAMLCPASTKGKTSAKNSQYFLSKESEKRLSEFFEPHNQDLYSMLNTSFDW